MVANINKLKGKMAENGYTTKLLSKEMGISETTFRRKVYYPDQDFKVGESQKIKEILKLTIAEYVNIFFNEELEFNASM